MNIETIASLFVSRSDAYAVQTDSGSWASLKRPVTSEVLIRHIDGQLTAGIYQLDIKSEVKWVCFDFDDGDAEVDARKLFAHIKTTEYAKAALLEHTGGRGYHVWIFFEDRVSAWHAKKIAENIVERAEVRCEIFPKEGKLAAGGYGHLVRLPQGIHKRTGLRSKLIEPDDLSKLAPVFIEPEEELSRETLKKPASDPCPCWEAMSAGVPKNCRNEVAYALARRLRTTFGFDEELCMKSLIEWNKRNAPPLHESEVAECVHSVYEKEYPNISCAQVKNHSLLSKFCDEGRCSWMARLDRCLSERPRSLLADEAPPKCKLNDESLVTRYWALIVESLGIADLTMLRCNDAIAVERIKSRLKEIEGRELWSEEELMKECGVRYTRTPCNQKLLITHAFFIGRLLILNREHQVVCPQYVWYARFLYADRASVRTSWAGLLMITPRRFEAAGLDDPESVFAGACIIVADGKDIVEVGTNLEERIATMVASQAQAERLLDSDTHIHTQENGEETIHLREASTTKLTKVVATKVSFEVYDCILAIALGRDDSVSSVVRGLLMRALAEDAGNLEGIDSSREGRR